MKKYKIILACLLTFTLASVIAGCTNNNESVGLENGFNVSGSAPNSFSYCAYKSDKTEFDIDDVTLDFFYGGYYASGIDSELENGKNYPIFELYFSDEAGDQFIVKRIEENFVSEKYSCELIYDENQFISEVEFNHSEQITIPKEIFTKENGQIWFEIYSENINELEPETTCIGGISIFYKVTEDKVILSSQKIV